MVEFKPCHRGYILVNNDLADRWNNCVTDYYWSILLVVVKVLSPFPRLRQYCMKLSSKLCLPWTIGHVSLVKQEQFSFEVTFFLEGVHVDQSLIIGVVFCLFLSVYLFVCSILLFHNSVRLSLIMVFWLPPWHLLYIFISVGSQII